MARMQLLQDAINNVVEGFCLVKSAAVRANSKGSDYLDIVLTDARGEIAAKLWDYDPAAHGVFHGEDIVKVRASITLWRDNEQLKIERIRHAAPEDGVELASLIPCAPYDSQWMFDQLMACAGEFRDEDLKRLTCHLLQQNHDTLLAAPGALKLHHAQHGGLLYHTYTMLRGARAVCNIYPRLDADLLYAGVLLHDLAKLEELQFGPLGIASGYTARGQLVGHIPMGLGAIERAADALYIDGELVTLLSHMLLSHHGVPEFGSPVPPMFPEAEALHALDVLDARMFEMFSALEGVEKGGFSERVWALDNRQLYQHGRAKEETE